MSAIDTWRTMIQAEHAQSDAMRPAPPPDDHWRPYARQFSADPRRSDDAMLNRLLEEVSPDHTVIDVGAGGGRLALPIALHCRHVTAVEPSPAMGEVLSTGAEDHKIDNISLVHSEWQNARVDPADQTLCVHVLYTIQDIGGFVKKLEAHARVQVMVVMYGAAPQSQNYPLWEKVHGTPRLPLPSVPEFREVLKELGIDAREEALPAQPARGFDSLEQALDQLSQRLYLGGDGPQRDMLARMLPQELEETDGVFRIRGAAPLQPWLIRWAGSASG
ncbi:MAG: methyltransferase domain-containing protein [Chloroflexi bacterium]|nr:methyltransferase domain-containing protein [Chloroflexota bacterium]